MILGETRALNLVAFATLEKHVALPTPVLIVASVPMSRMHFRPPHMVLLSLTTLRLLWIFREFC